MKPKVFLIIGLAMFVVMIIFLFYAANHPEGSFPWHYKITHIIYKVYLILMAASFLAAAVMKIVITIRKK